MSAARWRRIAAPLAVACAALVGAGAAGAQTFTVTNLENSGTGSLREAVKGANASAGPDTITFAAGLAGTITLTGTGLTIDESVTIDGPGAGLLTVAQATKGHRVFAVAEFPTPGAVSISGLHLLGTAFEEGGAVVDSHHSNTVLTIEGCLVTGGSTGGSFDQGGAIRADRASLVVRDSTFIGNEAHAGGAIWAGGFGGNTVTIEGSTFEGNVAESDGGAVLLETQEGGASGVIGSTFVGNRAGDRAGAMYAETSEESTLRIANSTFTGNQSSADGGALDLEGDELSQTIESSTFAGNRATGAGAEGGGIASARIEKMTDTIVAGNSAALAPDSNGNWTAAFDLVGNVAGTELIETVPGSSLTGVDPQLGPLAANGGPTETMALPPTSPAVNKGGGALTTDQRGDARPVIYPGVALSSAPGADGSDIGAYELAAPPATGAGTSPPLAPPPPPPSVTGKKPSPRVRVSCPKGAGAKGCAFAVQVVSGRPRKASGKGRRPKPPTAESAIAKAKLGAGKSTLLTLAPKPSFAARLDAAKSLLVREVETVGGQTRTTYRKLAVI